VRGGGERKGGKGRGFQARSPGALAAVPKRAEKASLSSDVFTAVPFQRARKKGEREAKSPHKRLWLARE